MKKPKGKIEWIIAVDDETWRASQAAVQSEPAHKTLRQKEVALATYIALLLLFLIGGWLWTRPVPARGKVAQAPTATLRPATANGAFAAQSLTRTLQALDNPIHIDAIQRAGDHIMAQVTVHYDEEGSVRVYHETRFYTKNPAVLYAKNGAEWQRSDPDLTLLGPQQQLTVANFTILYRAVDADAVYEVVPKLEERYTTLRRDFGLPVIVATSSYTVEVTTDRMQSLTNFNYLQYRIAVSSPILLSAPVTMSAAKLLYQEMVYPLAHLLLVESLHQHDELWRSHLTGWGALVSAIPLWELWDDGGPLASGRGEVVSWLYANKQGGQARHSLPTNYTHLCRTFAIWQSIPVVIGVPLVCAEMDNIPLPGFQYPKLATSWPQGMGYYRDASLPKKGVSESITMETILEYIVATYGRDKLPQLIDALGQYTTPETLIHALFGIAQADFEAGWQAYLVQHYH